MWKFCFGILVHMARAAVSAVYRVEASIGVVVFLLLLFNRALAERLLSWEGINPLWALIPIALVFGHLFLSAIYHQDCEREQRYQAKLSEVETQRDDAEADLKEVMASTPSAALEIQYDPNCHFTRHPSGDVEVRITVKNVGAVEAKRVRVKVESLVPLTHQRKASPYSTQFNALRLEVVRKKPGSSLQAGESDEVILLTAQKGGEFYLIHGYDRQEKPQSFCTPRAKYRVTIIASAMNATPAKRTFIVAPRKNREIEFEPDEV